MFDAIIIGKTKQKLKKRMNGNFSDVKYIIKNGQKSDSFTAHYEQYFKSTTPRTDLCKFMEFRVVKNINSIG